MKAKIDPEYNCVWGDEYKYLTEHGIKYTFVKTVNGVTVWKYKKSQKLFLHLANFYSR